MLNVLITVDTEVYPLVADWRLDTLRRDIRRDIYGETSKGNYGLLYQLEVLNRFGLKAVFFVESLFATVVGIEPLRELVRHIIQGGHEIQLHVHPEWLAWMESPPVVAAGRWAINQFSHHEQTQIIALGLRNLLDAGANRVSAFRAGDFAANAATLLALRQNGFRYDTSYNACCWNSFPDVTELRGTTQPKRLSGVCEVPISYWHTRPWRSRHAQVTNSSGAEMRSALLHADRNDWYSFVIVSHSFELLKKRRQRIGNPAPDRIVISRFVELCRFLSMNKEKFRTCGFDDLDPLAAISQFEKPPLRSPLFRTAFRLLQQVYRRLT